MHKMKADSLPDLVTMAARFGLPPTPRLCRSSRRVLRPKANPDCEADKLRDAGAYAYLRPARHPARRRWRYGIVQERPQ